MGEIPNVKHINIESGTFMANGKRYFIQDSLSLGRYKEYIKQQHIMAFRATPEDHMKFIDFVIKQMSGPLTGITVHSIIENAYNVKNAYEDFQDEDYDSIFRFAALFVNREGEDVSVFDNKVVRSKIEDWEKEGIDANDFFLLCARLSPSLRAKYLRLLPEKKQKETELDDKEAQD